MHAGPAEPTTTALAGAEPDAPTSTRATPLGVVAELEDVIREQRLAMTLPPGVITEHAQALAGARYDAPALRGALALEDFTRARGPGLLRATLGKFAANPRPDPHAAKQPRARRCPHHGTTFATFCGACRADVRAGDLAPEDASGDLPPDVRERLLALA